MLICVAFSQAKDDGVTILEIGGNVWDWESFFMEKSRSL